MATRTWCSGLLPSVRGTRAESFWTSTQDARPPALQEAHRVRDPFLDRTGPPEHWGKAGANHSASRQRGRGRTSGEGFPAKGGGGLCGIQLLGLGRHVGLPVQTIQGSSYSVTSPNPCHKPLEPVFIKLLIRCEEVQTNTTTMLGKTTHTCEGRSAKHPTANVSGRGGCPARPDESGAAPSPSPSAAGSPPGGTPHPAGASSRPTPPPGAADTGGSRATRRSPFPSPGVSGSRRCARTRAVCLRRALCMHGVPRSPLPPPFLPQIFPPPPTSDAPRQPAAPRSARRGRPRPWLHPPRAPRSSPRSRAGPRRALGRCPRFPSLAPSPSWGGIAPALRSGDSLRPCADSGRETPRCIRAAQLAAPILRLTRRVYGRVRPRCFRRSAGMPWRPTARRPALQDPQRFAGRPGA